VPRWDIHSKNTECYKQLINKNRGIKLTKNCTKKTLSRLQECIDTHKSHITVYNLYWHWWKIITRTAIYPATYGKSCTVFRYFTKRKKAYNGLQHYNLAFQSFDFERTWWRLFQKSVLGTKIDIYVFIHDTCEKSCNAAV
jgi:hypothetical protein